jgi:hypothetical protein
VDNNGNNDNKVNGDKNPLPAARCSHDAIVDGATLNRHTHDYRNLILTTAIVLLPCFLLLLLLLLCIALVFYPLAYAGSDCTAHSDLVHRPSPEARQQIHRPFPPPFSPPPFRRHVPHPPHPLLPPEH